MENWEAKSDKGRIVYLSKEARKVIWRYLAKSNDSEDPEAPQFVGKFNRAMNNDALRQFFLQCVREARQFYAIIITNSANSKTLNFTTSKE